MPVPRRRLAIAAAAAAVLVVSLLRQVPAPDTPSPAPAAAALRVQWDPESGSFVPAAAPDKAALAAAMARALDRSDEGLTARTHADGGVSVDLEGRFRSLSVATTGPDGAVRTGCVTNRAELDAFLAESASASASESASASGDHGKER